MRKLIFTLLCVFNAYIVFSCTTTVTGSAGLCAGAPISDSYTVDLDNTWGCSNFMRVSIPQGAGTIVSVTDNNGNALFVPPFSTSFFGAGLNFPLTVVVNWTQNGCQRVTAVGGDNSGTLWCGCDDDTDVLFVTVGNAPLLLPPLSNIVLIPGNTAQGCANNTFMAVGPAMGCATEYHWTIKGENITTPTNILSYFLESCPLGPVTVTMNTACGPTGFYTESFPCNSPTPLPPLTNITLNSNDIAEGCSNNTFIASGLLTFLATGFEWSINGETITTSTSTLNYFLEACPLGEVSVRMHIGCRATPWYTESFPCNSSTAPPPMTDIILTPGGSLAMACSNNKFVAVGSTSNGVIEYVWSINGEIITTSTNTLYYFLEACPLGAVSVQAVTVCGASEWYTEWFPCETPEAPPLIYPKSVCVDDFWELNLPGVLTNVQVSTNSGNVVMHDASSLWFTAVDIGLIKIEITYEFCGQLYTHVLKIFVVEDNGDCQPWKPEPVQNDREAELSEFRVDKKLALETLKLYPNPVGDYLSIEVLSENFEVSLFGLDGQLIQTLKGQSLKSEMDLSNLASGTYLLMVSDAQGVRTEKVVKI